MESVGNASPLSSQHPVFSVSWIAQGVGTLGFLILLTFTWLPNSYSRMVGWPYVLIWQTAFLLIVFCTIWLARKFKSPFERLGYGLDYVVILTIVVATLSTLTAQFQAVACWNLIQIINYAVCLYLLTNCLRNRTISRELLWGALSTTGVVTSIIGLAQWRPSLDMWLSEDFNSAVRNAQPLGHHNFVGGYELLLLPIVISLALSQKGWIRCVGLLASATVAVALYVSGSRGALIGLLGLGTICIGLGILLSQSHYRRRWVVVSCGFVLFMTLALVSNPRVRTLFSAEIAPVSQEMATVVSISDGPVKDRLFMLDSTLNILKDRPILGVGPGNLSRMYNTFRPIEAGAGLTLVQQVHNTPAQLAAELGILGIFIYVSLLTILTKLIISLHSSINEHRDRLLLYGIGASWLGYGISSLSDYQLENIGIASTLILTVALLLRLADIYQPSIKNLCLSNRKRRIISLCLLLLICINLQFWAKVDAGLYLSHIAVQDAKALNLAGADAKWEKASRIVPWDPTYPALAAEAVMELASSLDSESDIQKLRGMAIEYLQKAVQSAPNDPWFNQNLATLLIEHGDPVGAEAYARKAVRLSPRDVNNYTYYTLGISLLQQKKEKEAIEAFALESLANPIFLTSDDWERLPLLNIKEKVVETSLQHYIRILSETNKESHQYSWLQEQLALVSWWHGYPTSAQNITEMRQLVRALLVSNEDSPTALQLIEEFVQKGGKRSNDIYLLQARLSPDQYLPELTERLNDVVVEEFSLEESLRGNGTMQSWLNEVTEPAKTQIRYGLVYAYRNLAANVIRKIWYPGEIHISVLLSAGDWFLHPPREYPQLDRYMADLRAKHLSID